MYIQRIIDATGAETFAKEPELATILRKLKPAPVLRNKESLLLRLGALLRNNLQMGAFF